VIPRPRDVGANRQDGNLIIVIPKNERVVREEQQAKDNGERASGKGAEGVWSRMMVNETKHLVERSSGDPSLCPG
jgi:hypothetical protein